MIIKIFICGPIKNNTYLLAFEKTKKAIVIDPSFGSFDKIDTYLRKNEFKLDKILITHFHWDHIVDLALLKEKYNSPIYIHKLDKESIENPQNIPSFSLMDIPGIKPDVLLEDNEKIKFSDIDILTIHTPGHSKGSVCYYIEKEKILISGDTLFEDSFGRVDFPDSNSQDMIKSLKKLSKLPKDTKIYPGHGNITTIADQSWIENPEKFI